MKTSIDAITTTLLALCFLALPSITQALSPPPDGGYPGGNTAEGEGALSGPTISGYNTAIGYYSLASLTDDGFCTGVGAGTLLANIGQENTAVGAGALLSNTTASYNSADGAFALFSNTEGGWNTAIGHVALFANTTGGFNTALGDSALYSNISGTDNTAIGSGALYLCSGAGNVAVGAAAGQNATTGSNNVYIGAGINGVAGESDACRIASIYGATITSGIQVLVNSDNRFGTMTSSKRFKQNIAPTSGASEALYKLQPVTFQYKKEIDPEARRQFGLVAEDVEKVNPDLVVHDKEGKPYSVRYDQVNAMLLNEFLKEHKAFVEEHRKLEAQTRALKTDESEIARLKSDLATQRRELKSEVAAQRTDFETVIARQQKQIAELTAGLEKVSARFESSPSATNAVAEN